MLVTIKERLSTPHQKPVGNFKDSIDGSSETIEGHYLPSYLHVGMMLIFCMALLWFSSAFVYADEHVPELKIGVLAKRGSEICYQRWNETANYLEKALPQYHFTIIPLPFEKIEPAIKSKQIDFLLANPGIFVNLSFNYNLRAISTLKRRILGAGYTHFGSVVFTRSDNKTLHHFSDLVGQHVAAVNQDSLGGWIMSLREFNKDGFDIDKFSSLQFLGTHDAVIYAVLNGNADVGIVRTDTLERMAAEGKINLEEIKHLTSASTATANLSGTEKPAHFPLMLSSRLYPEWPFAALSHVTDDMADQIAAALISMPADSLAATSAQIMGWTIPKNYREVELAYNELKLGVFAELTDYTFLDVMKRYWHYFLATFFILFVMAAITLYILRLNCRLKNSEHKLRKMATHDALTGLPNRLLFKEMADKYLEIASREKHQAMVLFIDLDNFKPINDTYGHDVGDLVLKESAKHILSVLRSNDIVARIGGDEFLLMLWNFESIQQTEQIMQRLIDNLSLPILDRDGNKLQISCSIGASIYPKDGNTLESLITTADQALYAAKEQGRAKFVFYDPANHASQDQRYQTESAYETPKPPPPGVTIST